MTSHRWPASPHPRTLLIDPAQLERAYFDARARSRRPDPARQLRHQRASRLVARAARSPRRTSWPSRRRSASTARAQGIDGPLFLGKDTHALSGARAAHRARGARRQRRRTTVIQRDDGFTPTPVISHAILAHNRGRTAHLADGIVITPSHNPPEDGGFKYNPPNGGPADTDVTRWIQDRANELLRGRQRRREAHAATRAALRRRHDARGRLRPARTSTTCANVIDMDAIRGARPEARRRSARRRRRRTTGSRSPRVYGLDLDGREPGVDPTFAFMTVDHDGKIRMDCSSPLRDGAAGRR